jgi:hypothetical protein
MVNTNDYWIYLSRFLPLTPIYAVWFIGLIVALVRWNRHPKVSLLVTLATVLLFLNSVVANLLSIWLIHYSRDQAGFSHERMGWMLGVLGFVSPLVGAAGYAMLLVAAFMGRGQWLAEWREGNRPPA